MGSTSMYRPPGQTTAAFLAVELGVTFKATGIVGGTFYGAATTDQDPDTVFGVVVLFQWQRGYFNFWYKAMTEDMGPNEERAPARVLNALTPTTARYAQEWRGACKANLAEQAAKPQIKPGDTFRLTQPQEFGNGRAYDTFTLIEKNVLRTDTGVTVRFPKWRDRDYQAVA